MLTTPRIEVTAEELRAALVAEGSITKAAARLGVTRQTVHRWLRKYDIEVKRGIQTA